MDFALMPAFLKGNHLKNQEIYADTFNKQDQATANYSINRRHLT